jgi:hypothetical protein
MNASNTGRRPETPVPTRRRALVVSQAPDGRWWVRDRRQGLERSFATQRAALRFALFEWSGRSAVSAALVVPPTGRAQPDDE